MTLYSADVTKLAKPVKKMQTAHKKLLSKTTKMPEPETHQVEVQLPKKLKKVAVKKTIGKKVKAPKKVVEQEEDEQEEDEEEEEKGEEVEKVKPPPKKRARKVPVPELTPEPSPQSSPEPVKKKRVRKVAAPQPASEPSPEPPKKRVRKQTPKGEPPQWFQKYVEGVKKEEAVQKVEKVPAKQVKIEAQQAAQKSWDDGLTRDRVSNEVDNHMNRMYGMIFAKR